MKKKIAVFLSAVMIFANFDNCFLIRAEEPNNIVSCKEEVSVEENAVSVPDISGDIDSASEDIVLEEADFWEEDNCLETEDDASELAESMEISADDGSDSTAASADNPGEITDSDGMFNETAFEDGWIQTDEYEKPAERLEVEEGTKLSGNIFINGVDIGYAGGDYFSTTGKECACHGRGTCGEASDCTCTTENGACQCYGFAKWCQKKLFGCSETGAGSPAQFMNLGSLSAGNMSAENLKELLYGKAMPGAHIRTAGDQHSLIITSIDENGFSIVQANGSNNLEYSGYYKCRIGTYDYTWQSYAASTYGQRGIAYVNTPKELPFEGVLDEPVAGAVYECQDVIFQGWAICGTGAAEVFCVMNGSDRYDCAHYTREDVKEKYSILETNQVGFQIRIPKEILKSGENTFLLQGYDKQGNEHTIAEGSVFYKGIKVTPDNIELWKSEKRILEVNQLSDDYIWSSSDTSVATVTQTGIVFAAGKGTAVITVTDGEDSGNCTVTVKEPSIRLSSSKTSIYKDCTKTLTATVKGKSQTVTWSSDNKKIATVSSAGKVTGIAAGTATITAKANGVTAKCTITVLKPTIKLSGSSGSVYKGCLKKLTATVKGKSQTVVWSSANKNIAVVSKYGNIYGANPGKTVITAKANGVTAKYVITVLKPVVKFKENRISMRIGQKETFSVTVKGKSSTVAWASTNTQVAKVTSSGKVYALGTGTCYIIARANGVSAYCKVTVIRSRVSISLSKLSVYLNKNGKFTLKATVLGTLQKPIWRSSNPGIATVSSNGVVTAKKAGVAYITAWVGNEKAECKIYVHNYIELLQFWGQDVNTVKNGLKKKVNYGNGWTISEDYPRKYFYVHGGPTFTAFYGNSVNQIDYCTPFMGGFSVNGIYPGMDMTQACQELTSRGWSKISSSLRKKLIEEYKFNALKNTVQNRAYTKGNYIFVMAGSELVGGILYSKIIPDKEHILFKYISFA